MLPLDLKTADLRTFHRTLADTHNVAIRVEVMNLDGDHLTHLDPQMIDGQVNIDAHAHISRSATLSVFDPNRSLHFESDAVTDGALFLDRMIRIVYSVNVPTLGWVHVPIFTGPVTKLDRNDDLISIECQGKEILAMHPAWHPMQLKKGHNKVDAIRLILKERAGENSFDLPDLSARLGKKGGVALGRESQPWHAARRIAHSMDRQLFYDGRGRVRLRKEPGQVYTFRDGDGGTIMTPIQASYDTENIRNTVWIKGGKPRGSKKDGTGGKNDNRPEIEYVLMAPHHHPLSPQRLGRNGVPLHLVEVVANPHIRSKKEASRIAHRRLHNLLLESVTMSFEALPIPHLEPMDLVKVDSDEGTFHMRLTQFSIPLGTGANMSVGFMKRVSFPPRRVRRIR